MTHDLRRLRLHGLIERIPRSHRYRLTALGAVVAQFYSRFYARALRPSLSVELQPSCSPRSSASFAQLERAIGKILQEVHLAA
jgi:hypothetical protein